MPSADRHSLVEVLSRAFYAMHDTKTPVIVGVMAMTGNILLSFAFSRLFRHWLALGGLALLTACNGGGVPVLLQILRKTLNGLAGRQIYFLVGKHYQQSCHGIDFMWLDGDFWGRTSTWCWGEWRLDCWFMPQYYGCSRYRNFKPSFNASNVSW